MNIDPNEKISINKLKDVQFVANTFPIGYEELFNGIKDTFQIEHETLNSFVQGKGGLTIVNLIQVSFDLTSKRLRSPSPVNEKDVNDINLLFQLGKKLYGEAEFDTLINHQHEYKPVINPHPYNLLNKLDGFFKKLPKDQTCQSIISSVPEIQRNWKIIEKTGPQQEAAKEIEPSSKKRTLEIDYETASQPSKREAIEFEIETDIAYRERLKDYPIVRTDLLFGTDRTAHNTYVLIGEKKECLGIFKPLEANENRKEIVYREQACSLVNFHHVFPVPFTMLLEVKGWTGSMQIYINQARSMESIELDRESRPDFSENIRNDLQKLIIFDLIFANGDPNTGNILFSYEGDNKQNLGSMYGIDHDSCMQGLGDKTTKYQSSNLDLGDYIMFQLEKGEAVEDGKFDPNLKKSLLLDEHIHKYAELMRIHQDFIPQEAISWMQIAAEVLRNDEIYEKKIGDVVDMIQDFLAKIGITKEEKNDSTLSLEEMRNIWKQTQQSMDEEKFDESSD